MRAHLASSLAFALTLIAPPATAFPMTRFTWGPANGLIVNQDFAGPQTYTQTLSVIGLSGTVSKFTMQVLHAYPGPGTAWHAISPPLFTLVSAPQPDCEGEPGFSIGSTVAGATTIPNAVPTATLGCSEGVTNHAVTCYMTIEVTINPPFVADPAIRYGIVTLEYHHQNSVAGVSPDACDYADLPMCFAQQNSSAVVNGVTTTLSNEGGLLSWENDPMVVDCWRAITPARPSSWGSIKTLYR